MTLTPEMMAATRGTNEVTYRGDGSLEFQKRNQNWVAKFAELKAMIAEYDGKHEDMRVIELDLAGLSDDATDRYVELEAAHNAAIERGESDESTCLESMRESRRADAAETNFFREGLR